MRNANDKCKNVLFYANGQAFIMVIMAMSLLFAITASLGVLVGHVRGNVVNEHSMTQALYTADAGIEKTIVKVKSEVHLKPSWYTGLSSYSYANILSGSLKQNVNYSVAAKKADRYIGTSLLLQSIGKCLDKDANLVAQKTLQADLAVFTTADYLQGFSILPEEPNDLGTTVNAIVNANFVLNGSIDLNGLTQINGNTIASGSIAGNCAGSNIQYYAYIPPPPCLDDSYYREKSEADELSSGEVHVYPSGSYHFGSTETVKLYEGFYFINGDIDIEGEYQGSSVIFATGNINIIGDLKPSDGDDPVATVNKMTLIAQGNINIECLSVYANLMSGETIRRTALNNEHLEIFGAVCAAGVDISTGSGGTTTVNYNSQMAPDNDSIPVTIKLVDWKELYPVF